MLEVTIKVLLTIGLITFFWIYNRRDKKRYEKEAIELLSSGRSVWGRYLLPKNKRIR